MKFSALIWIALPTISLAEDKPGAAPRSLADEAAYLGGKGGIPWVKDSGWKSAEVTVTSATGEKQKTNLLMWFESEKDKPSGNVWLGCRLPDGGGGAGVVGFALEEKDGKRYLNITEGERGTGLFITNPKVIATLDYSIQSETLTLKGGEIPDWARTKADFTQPIVFKPAKK
jgi:hypothetical protein